MITEAITAAVSAHDRAVGIWIIVGVFIVVAVVIVLLGRR